MKYILFAFHVIFISVIVKGQFKDPDVQLHSIIPSNQYLNDSREALPGFSQPSISNSVSNAPSLLKKRKIDLLLYLPDMPEPKANQGSILKLCEFTSLAASPSEYMNKEGGHRIIDFDKKRAKSTPANKEGNNIIL